MILIVDYDMGNVGAIRNMLMRVGARDVVLSADPTDCTRADKIILPGVGAFDVAMRNLNERGFVPALAAAVRQRGVPLLGICLGMQLLAAGSEEGELPGLGLVPGHVKRFDPEVGGRRIRIPHMGWNAVESTRRHSLFVTDADELRFYFVHSYHFVCDTPEYVIGQTEYGSRFTSAVACGNVAGVQFHPEKSHRFGMRLLSNFAGTA